MTVDPYSASRVTSGVAYLVVGKAITSVAGIGTFLLLVRSLPVEQFAAYTVLFALVELVDAATGVGLAHVLSRYVPELYVRQRIGSMRRLMAWALSLRLGVVVIALTAIYLLVGKLSPWIGLAGFEWAFQAYLAVVLAKVAATTIFTVLESMLHQKAAQLGFGFVTVSRFALLALAASHGTLDLATVIAIEFATDAAGFAILFFALLRAIRGQQAARGDADWMDSNLRRMSEFGLKGYLQHLLILPYGSSINRLLVGGSLTTPEVALFGFAQSIADLMERYLPVKLLSGVIRPVLTARYVRDGKFADLELSANLIFKINSVLISLGAVVVVAGGEEMVALVTGGRYSDGSVGLLLLMCALVLMYSLRYMLDHVSHAVERNGPLIWSNAVITGSVLPGVALLPHLGVYALPSANLAGLVVGSAVLIWRLGRDGFKYHHDLSGLANMLLATGGAIGIAEISRWGGASWPVAVIAAVPVFAALCFAFKPWRLEEKALLASIVRR